IGSTSAFAVVLLLLVGILALSRKWLDLILLVTQLVVAFVFYKGLKEVFGRVRPDIEHLIEASGYSFPSGNALMSAAFYGWAGIVLALNIRNKIGSTVIQVVSVLVIFLA